MIAIITGDIINSGASEGSEWMPLLKNYLSKIGKAPQDWEIYRGDEFQIRTTPEKALHAVIYIKALLKSMKGMDVRLAIGIGKETFKGNSVSESNGTAYQYSGRMFETLKEHKINLALASGNNEYDQTLNLMLKLGLDFMDGWTKVSAEIITLALENPEASQQKLALKLRIRQSAISQRKKRARLDLVLELLEYYAQTIKKSKA